MKVAMVLFPGSNCEWETLAFLRRAYGKKNVTTLWHRDRFDPKAFDLVYLPGGFSYGDYVRAGACAALSPAMQDVYHHAQRGAYVIGVCNGFQILLEAQLLPGALIRNTSGYFECRWMEVDLNTHHCLGWEIPKREHLQLPIANKFGRYYLPPGYRLATEDQIVLRYVETGEPAGITNTQGNILGMMPHPERAAFSWHPSIDGQLLLPGVT